MAVHRPAPTNPLIVTRGIATEEKTKYTLPKGKDLGKTLPSPRVTEDSYGLLKQDILKTLIVAGVILVIILLVTWKLR